jgi:hypothetical protein
LNIKALTKNNIPEIISIGSQKLRERLIGNNGLNKTAIEIKRMIARLLYDRYALKTI